MRNATNTVLLALCLPAFAILALFSLWVLCHYVAALVRAVFG